LSRASQLLARLFGRSARPSPEFPASPENGHADLERTLGYKFKQLELLDIALTHPSAVTVGEPHYERLEFLGDAVLDLAIADLLMRRFPEAKEGALSKERASVVNGRTLAVKALAIGLVDKVVPDAEVHDAARELVAQYARGPALALRAAKQAIDDGLEVDLSTGLEIERLQFAALFARVKDDGRAEAALIAVAGLMRKGGAP